MQFRGTLSRLGVAALAVATVVAGSAYVSSAVHAQAPSSVPSARFYGTVRTPAGQPATNVTITGAVGNVVCSGTQAISGSQGTSGTDNSGNYALDIQAVPGCTTPGATVVFTASSGAMGTYRARETGTIPDIPGTAVRLNLTLQLPTPATATATAPPPPPPPTVRPSATPAPPPPPPATAAPTPRPTATATPRPAPTQVVQQAPRGPVKGPVVAQGPKVAQAPRVAGPAYVAPATAPRLPSTGTGGLLDQQANSGMTLWALAAIVLAGLGISATGLLTYRRSH